MQRTQLRLAADIDSGGELAVGDILDEDVFFSARREPDQAEIQSGARFTIAVSAFVESIGPTVIIETHLNLRGSSIKRGIASHEDIHHIIGLGHIGEQIYLCKI